MNFEKNTYKANNNDNLCTACRIWLDVAIFEFVFDFHHRIASVFLTIGSEVGEMEMFN